MRCSIGAGTFPLPFTQQLQLVRDFGAQLGVELTQPGIVEQSTVFVAPVEKLENQQLSQQLRASRG
jgi:hypothetical protein